MKKLLTTTAIILSLSCAAQDTTYYQKRDDIYMSIRTKVTDDKVYKQHYSLQLKKRRRNDRIFTIVTTSIFTGISIWFWKGYRP